MTHTCRMYCSKFTVILSVVFLAAVEGSQLGTAERIASYGFKVENHTVTTSDGYILTLFRISDSTEASNHGSSTKPIVFLQHGLVASSDCWIVSDREDSLALMLADAGYDVWLGNSRGNTYSRRHTSLSPNSTQFWRFSWHEIAIYDLPACIDYIQRVTGQASMHYVGHSQGSTVFMVMLSLLPQYNRVFKSTHMLAPVLYVAHIKGLPRLLAKFLGRPSPLIRLLAEREFTGRTGLLARLTTTLCTDNSPVLHKCEFLLQLVGGLGSRQLNTSLLPAIFETLPAGASLVQLVHYLQENLSGRFRQYDFGIRRNLEIYGQSTPPSYPLGNIRPSEPIDFYYSDNDNWSDPADVQHFSQKLGSRIRMNHIKYPTWNHMDFLWAKEVRTEINEPILKKIRDYESNRLGN